MNQHPLFKTQDSLCPLPNRIAMAALLTLALLPGWAVPQDYSIDFFTIDGGGELMSESADNRWQLSGTIGQPDSTKLLELSGSGYTLTGGFWPVNIEETDILFRDGYEG